MKAWGFAMLALTAVVIAPTPCVREFRRRSRVCNNAFRSPYDGRDPWPAMFFGQLTHLDLTMPGSLQGEEIAGALRALGLPVSTVWDLVNAGESYPNAVPLLLRLLPMDMDPALKKGIVRSLTVKEARGIASEPLIEEFRKATDPDSSLKWAIGNALSVVADETVFDQIVDLVFDRRNGRGRRMLVEALGKMKNPRAVDVAIELLKDEEVAGHAIVALRKLRATKARPYLEPFLDSPYAWIRREAKQALKRIDIQSSRPQRRARRSR